MTVAMGYAHLGLQRGIAQMAVAAHNIANLTTRTTRQQASDRPPAGPVSLAEEIVAHSVGAYTVRANIVMLQGQDEVMRSIIDLKA